MIDVWVTTCTQMLKSNLEGDIGKPMGTLQQTSLRLRTAAMTHSPYHAEPAEQTNQRRTTLGATVYLEPYSIHS